MRLNWCRVSHCRLGQIDKTYFWKSVGLPSLLYNLESTSIPDICTRQVENTQSSTIKRLLSFPVRSHHTNVLRALNLSKVQSRIDKATLSLWYCIFQVDSQTILLCAKLLSDFILYNYSVPVTLIDRIIKMKLSPVKCLFRRMIPNAIEEAHHDGVVESLRYLILHENFIKPYSSEHIIASLLTKAFWTWVISLMVHAGPLLGTCGLAACAIGCACHPRPRGLTPGVSCGWPHCRRSRCWSQSGHWATAMVAGTGSSCLVLLSTDRKAGRRGGTASVACPMYSLNLKDIQIQTITDYHNACGVVLIELWYFISSRWFYVR